MSFTQGTVTALHLHILEWVDRTHPTVAYASAINKRDTHNFLIAFGELVDAGWIADGRDASHYVTRRGWLAMRQEVTEVIDRAADAARRAFNSPAGQTVGEREEMWRDVARSVIGEWKERLGAEG